MNNRDLAILCNGTKLPIFGLKITESSLLLLATKPRLQTKYDSYLSIPSN